MLKKKKKKGGGGVGQEAQDAKWRQQCPLERGGEWKGLVMWSLDRGFGWELPGARAE